MKPQRRQSLAIAPAIALLSASLLFTSCAGLKNNPKNQLVDGVYWYKTDGASYKKLRIFVHEDSLAAVEYRQPTVATQLSSTTTEFFLKKTFDVDVMTVPFRYRPQTFNLPQQLTTDFNGNIFVGYRMDRFRRDHKQTPMGNIEHFSHRGITGGFFGGIASSDITPSTTNSLVADEYSGFVLTRGLAIMVGFNTLTVGIGVGWDYLTGDDKSLWIYQNKPWYGLTLGLNLN